LYLQGEAGSPKVHSGQRKRYGGRYRHYPSHAEKEAVAIRLLKESQMCKAKLKSGPEAKLNDGRQAKFKRGPKLKFPTYPNQLGTTEKMNRIKFLLKEEFRNQIPQIVRQTMPTVNDFVIIFCEANENHIFIGKFLGNNASLVPTNSSEGNDEVKVCWILDHLIFRNN